VLVSLLEVGIWIEQLTHFDFGRSGLQFSQRTPWIEDLGVSYHVGEYGFSLWLVGLTVVAMAAAIGYGFWVGRDRPRAYFGLMLFLTGATVGVFVAQDLLLFYAFFEAMLIPLYILVGVWGGPGRLGATVKFLIYTMAGSLLMLAALIVYGLKAGTFDLVDAPPSVSRWIFLGFMFAFVIKAPLFPFHGWLPDAYREAPPEVSAVLSGVIAKAGLYGMLRIAITKFPEPTSFYRTAVLALAAMALVYGSLLAFRSADFRGVVAYSSLAQSGLIALGLFAGKDLGFDGAVLQMVAHGLISASLFLIAGAVERRTTTGEFRLLGGMARGRPALATLLMTVGVISLAVPGSASFAGEFLILAGVFQRAWWWSAIGAGAIVLAAMYMLRLISAVLHEARGSTVADEALDLRPGELALVVPLVGVLLALSAWPAGISHHSFFGPSPTATVKGQFK
jgi:NADH-quinone oxidoreductase subunit M